MRYILLLTVLLASNAFAEDTDVEIRCKVLDQIVMKLGERKLQWSCSFG